MSKPSKAPNIVPYAPARKVLSEQRLHLLDGEMGSSLPDAATPMFGTMLDLLEVLNGKIGELDKEIARRAREDVIAKRLMTIPGVGPITATAIPPSHEAVVVAMRGP